MFEKSIRRFILENSISMVNVYISKLSLFKNQNSFLKTVLHQKQTILEKVLDSQKDELKITCSNKSHNKHDNNLSNFDNTKFDKNQTVKNKSMEIPQFTITRKISFIINNKKVIAVGDSITKFLQSVELSTSER